MLDSNLRLLPEGFHFVDPEVLAAAMDGRNARFVSEASRLIVESGRAYFSTFFGSETQAAEHISRWFGRPGSVFAAANVTLLSAGDVLAGCLVALSGSALEKAQKADLAFLLQTLSTAERSELVARIRGRSGVSAKAAPDEFYIRALAVAESFRGRKLGRFLLEKANLLAAAAGCKSCKLDVYASNTAALRLYENAGFEAVAEQFDPVTQDHIRTM